MEGRGKKDRRRREISFPTTRKPSPPFPADAACPRTELACHAAEGTQLCVRGSKVYEL